MHVWSRTCFY